ncbi:MAG: hypothetical protein ACXABY_11485 [Candidatus Thorarchaeota archaeon]|jgi:hypothetical protein
MPNGENDGLLYAPYVPIQKTPTTMDVEDFFTKTQIANWSMKVVNPDWYGTVTLNDLGKSTPKLVQGWLFDDN